MSKVVRFRRLKHGDPPRFKVLPDELRKSGARNRYRAPKIAFQILVFALLGIAAALVVGGLVA
jgi:hypothetical protein